MAKVIIDNANLTAIAAAIREKNGETTTYKPAEMAAAITSLTIGNSEIPEAAFKNNYPNNGYRFYAGNGAWLWDKYASQFEVLTMAQGMFGEYILMEEIPITLKSNCGPLYQGLEKAFYNCQNLKEISNFEVVDVSSYVGCPTNELFYGCHNLRTIPANFFGTNCADISTSTSYKPHRQAMFQNCYSLRQLPNLTMLNDYSDSYITSIYYNMLSSCYALDEATNLPVSSGTFDANMFNKAFIYTNRLKELTFTTDSGVAKTANWSKQTINLSYYCGYCDSTNRITDYNSGCSGLVNSSSAYSTYKNTADWYSNDYRYSRYNKTSLINTINSLPDTSAYLATTGGTNTIKLKTGAGKSTDGGAVDSLTEEQIAVAAAKGWTIAYVEYESL